MFKKRLIQITIVIVLLLIGYFYFVSHFHYSEGSRTGYLSKLIRVGVVFKTDEGQIYLGGVNSENNTVVNNQWDFSIPNNDNGVLDSLQKYQGSIITVYYYKVIKNMPWQGETQYFVNKVEYVREK